MPDLWRIPRGSLQEPTDGNRKIARRPVFDLAVLQGLIADGTLGEDDVWVATDRCERDLENAQWDYGTVLHLLSCLDAKDFKGAEWCTVKGGACHACDVYRLNFDFERGVRNPRGLEVYVKFSVTDDGQLSLVLVSCHGSR